MRKKREFIEGTFYHVTSRTNDKIRIFENRLGRKIMLMVLHDAKAKFRFRLANFCVMPTHIHLLIEPAVFLLPAHTGRGLLNLACHPRATLCFLLTLFLLYYYSILLQRNYKLKLCSWNDRLNTLQVVIVENQKNYTIPKILANIS